MTTRDHEDQQQMMGAELQTLAGNDVQVALDAGRQMAQPVALELGKVHLVHTRSGARTIDLTGDSYRDVPRRKTGLVTLADVDSFGHYLQRHADPDGTEVFADLKQYAITAVLNSHTSGPDASAGWGDHRAVFKLELHPAWVAWNHSDNRLMDQVTFAEHLEQHRTWVIDPPAATLLEIAQTFQARTNVQFKSGVQIKSGQRVLQYTEDTRASAGSNGSIEIPDSFQLGLPVFRGVNERYPVEARLQFRISEGDLRLRYVLVDPDSLVERVFGDVVDQVADDTGFFVMRGQVAR